jgi:hypothetical protein
MLRRLWHAIRPAILWSYSRGSWQYDVIVAGILAFIFLTPRSLFNDEPHPPSVQEIEVLQDERGLVVFWVDAGAMANTPPEETSGKLEALLRERSGRALRVIEVRPSTDVEGDVRAYLVYAKP